MFLRSRTASVPASDDEVRSTTNVINDDAPSAVQEDAPEWNETRTDPDTEGGITPRQLASHVIPIQQYVPNVGDSNVDHNAIVNNQVSTSGTAAAREAAGEWGHGTMLITEGIEPVIRDGTAFDDVYFSVGKKDVQEGMGGYMQPAQRADTATVADAQSTGKVAARDAVSADMYTAFLNERLGR